MSQKIFRLSDDEREWIEVGQIGEEKGFFAAASLNGKIYITGGWNEYTLKSNSSIFLNSVMECSNLVCASILPLPLAVEFLESLI